MGATLERVKSGVLLVFLLVAGFLFAIIFGERYFPSPHPGRVWPEGNHLNGTPESVLLREGEPWWPLAQNLAWIEEHDPLDYTDYLERLQGAGVELVRVVLVPWHLHDGWDSIGAYDERRLDELGAMLDAAEERNLSIILSLDIYGELRTESHDSREMLWEDNPYNRENGGMLDSPEDFFTDAEAKESYRHRLERLVQEIGDSEALYAWEFWNEVDLTDNFDESAVCAWHEEMAGFLNRIDPAERYITTSFADFRRGDCVWKLDGIDIVMVHYYGKDVIERIPELHEQASVYGKPVILEEFAWGTSAGIDNGDPEGKHLIDAIRAARDAGFAAGPMIWWWDSYVEENDLYSVYSSVD